MHGNAAGVLSDIWHNKTMRLGGQQINSFWRVAASAGVSDNDR